MQWKTHHSLVTPRCMLVVGRAPLTLIFARCIFTCVWMSFKPYITHPHVSQKLRRHSNIFFFKATPIIIGFILKSFLISHTPFTRFQNMSYKLLLAEALEVIKEAGRDEMACDSLQKKYSENSKYRSQLPSLRRQYASVFSKRIRGLEMLNHVRVMSDDVGLRKFCADTMVAGMDACERVRDKETSILLPAGLVQGTFSMDSHTLVSDKGQRTTVDTMRSEGPRADGVVITKDGYARLGAPIFALGEDGADTLKGSHPLRHEFALGGGAYQLAIINNDAFAVAAPEIDVVIQSESPSTGAKMLYRKKLPAGCAWCRFIGVVRNTNIKLALSSDAWLRSSKIRIELSRITNRRDEYGNPVADDAENAGAAQATFETGGGGTVMWDPAAEERAAMARAAAMAAASPSEEQGYAGVEGCYPPAAVYDPTVPSWLTDAHVPSGYLAAAGGADVAQMLAPAAIVGPSSRADDGDMAGARAVVHAPPTIGGVSRGGGAPSPADAFAAANPNYNGPRVEISPLNCPANERLRRIKNCSWQWYEEAPHGFGAAEYNRGESAANAELLAAIEGLAEPTPLDFGE